MGVVNRLALDGREPELAACCRDGGCDPTEVWREFRAARERNADALHQLVDRPVQTNEVGRCAALLVGFLTGALESELLCASWRYSALGTIEDYDSLVMGSRRAIAGGLLLLGAVFVAHAVAAPAPEPEVPSCDGHKATIIGTNGPDVLVGTPGPDVIWGGAGNDVIYGLGGNDIICGGSGNDVIYGGSGNDIVFGGSGNDVIYGEAGNDVLNGGSGSNII